MIFMLCLFIGLLCAIEQKIKHLYGALCCYYCIFSLTQCD